jgi:gamma-glutamylcyclotransferase (GGCT)/AIG2-like uncharacterized protein YtfP
MLSHVFCYGTLLVPDLVSSLIGVDADDLQYTPAVLPKYKRYSVKNERYPVIKPHHKCSTKGYLLLIENEAQLKAIDEWEGDLYRRIEVEVESEGKIIMAYTYADTEDKLKIVDKKWKLENFTSDIARHYMWE